MKTAIAFYLFSAIMPSSLFGQTQQGSGKDWPSNQMRAASEKQYQFQKLLFQARTNEQAAEAWFGLNEATDEFAKTLTKVCHGNSAPRNMKCLIAANQGSSNGVPVFWCDPNAQWSVKPLGYLAALQLSPKGAHAEEAWWRGRLRHSTCGEYEGTKEEAEEGVKDYSEFLKSFPHGKHTEKARELLKMYETDLAGYK